MSQEREETDFRFDIVDAFALLLVASLLSLANARVRVEPMRFERNGLIQMPLERSHVIGWPAPIRRWTPGEESESWLPGGIVLDVVFAVVLAGVAVFARRAVTNWFAARKRKRESAQER
ncbi:MAG TPA: hypothetical protein VGN57_01480 [Pirellulaceae bacterium]|jgi:hypothetical protein|nr:hypothetical protein [Pirellulaceae bacterium]